MPTNRRRRTLKRRPKELTFQQRRHLLEGVDFFCDAYAGKDAEFEVAWRANRGALLRDYIKENPGKRPYAWWKLEALGPRRLLSGQVEAVDKELYFGLPRRTSAPYQEEQFEGQGVYLSRLDLLTRAEKKELRC